jgi:hypothetical protein
VMRRTDAPPKHPLIKVFLGALMISAFPRYAKNGAA